MTYILCPGIVVSETDGDAHFISASTLARLYGVDICTCKVIGFSQRDRGDGDIFLGPKSDGNYSLEREIECQQNKLQKAAAAKPAAEAKAGHQEST